MVVIKAMGMESDQEVVQMLGRDPRYSALLMPSLEVRIHSKMCLALMGSLNTSRKYDLG